LYFLGKEWKEIEENTFKEVTSIYPRKLSFKSKTDSSIKFDI